LGRAFEFYNAHPYLCGYLLGAAARLEEEGQGEALARLKRAAIPPLGAVGDRLFWAGLKPLSGVLAVLALLPAARHPGGSLLLALGVGAALLATAAYNWAHLAWRWRALREGHRLGLGVSAAIRALASHPLVAGSSTALALAAGLALPMALPWAAGAGDQAGTGLFFVVALASWQLPARSWTLPLLLVALLAAWTL
jgi:mannose/fructose/N-acetylgalactosamine-specific phosphotransferase system component IID